MGLMEHWLGVWIGVFIVVAGQDYSGMLGNTFVFSGHLSLSEMPTVKCLLSH